MLETLETSAFMIVDPFDKTYNPGKTIKLLKHEKHVAYLDSFELLYKRASMKGVIGLDVKKISNF